MTDLYELARRAHYHTSFTPDKRAAAFVEGHAKDIENLRALDIPEEYIKRFEALTVRWLQVKSRCISSMITGPANFPVARAEKANRAEHNASQACTEYYNKIVNYAKNEKYYAEHPEKRPIMSGDSDALERLKDKLAALNATQERMKLINKAHRAYTKNPESLDKSGLDDSAKQIIRQYKPAYSWEPNPFAPFELTNNNAKIKQTQDRIKELENRKATTPKDITINGVRVLENTEAMRLQLFFDGKPSAEIIRLLKSHAFKWSPSNMAWQRQLTNNAIYSFNHFVMPALKAV